MPQHVSGNVLQFAGYLTIVAAARPTDFLFLFFLIRQPARNATFVMRFISPCSYEALWLMMTDDPPFSLPAAGDER